MHRRLAAVCVLAGCGRIAFDERIDAIRAACIRNSTVSDPVALAGNLTLEILAFQ